MLRSMEDEILDMVKERNLDLLGVAETRHRDESTGQDLGDEYVLIYHGVDAGIRKHGVAMIIYAPQQGHTQEEKDAFMELLELHLEGQPEGINLLLRDFNARVGYERRGIESVIAPFGEETRNVEGENLIDFCIRNQLKIMK
ncbi:uncharacterized protein [Palaemon carinicauda]|uniref:uncharacterized protein n=1 Tax=Palaemon carinicauda TaxID=392227 RepID=UPI0035B60D3C